MPWPSCDDLMATGERGFTVQRLINLRDGYGAETDVLPKKMFKAASEGHRAGEVPPVVYMLKEYYGSRGWNNNGEPTNEK